MRQHLNIFKILKCKTNIKCKTNLEIKCDLKTFNDSFLCIRRWVSFLNKQQPRGWVFCQQDNLNSINLEFGFKLSNPPVNWSVHLCWFQIEFGAKRRTRPDFYIEFRFFSQLNHRGDLLAVNHWRRHWYLRFMSTH